VTPQERTLRARLGAYSRLAREDAHEMTAPARRSWATKWEQQVDPSGVLAPEERARRARAAMRAHMARLALASAKARKRR